MRTTAAVFTVVLLAAPAAMAQVPTTTSDSGGRWVARPAWGGGPVVLPRLAVPNGTGRGGRGSFGAPYGVVGPNGNVSDRADVGVVRAYRNAEREAQAAQEANAAAAPSARGGGPPSAAATNAPSAGAGAAPSAPNAPSATNAPSAAQPNAPTQGAATTNANGAAQNAGNGAAVQGATTTNNAPVIVGGYAPWGSGEWWPQSTTPQGANNGAAGAGATSTGSSSTGEGANYYQPPFAYGRAGWWGYGGGPSSLDPQYYGTSDLTSGYLAPSYYDTWTAPTAGWTSSTPPSQQPQQPTNATGGY